MSIIENLQNADTDAIAFGQFFNEDATFTVVRRIASNIYTLDHYLQYLDAIQLIYTQDTGTVTLAGVERKTIGQLELDAASAVQAAIDNAGIEGGIADTLVVTQYADGDPRTQDDKNKEHISALDFFTSAERASYNSDKTTFDAHRPLQAFLTHITNNDVGTAYCDGVFYIGSGLTLGGVNKSATNNVIGCLDLRALNAIDTMFLSQTGHDFVWTGSVKVTGTGGVAYAGRTCRVGVQVGGDYDGARSQYGMIYARYFGQIGVAVENNTTLTEFENIKAYDCGSGFSLAGYSLESTYTAAQEGSQGSVAQRSALTVTTLPPTLPAGMPMFVAVGTDYYYIYDVDTANGIVRVFPWVKDSQLSGTLRYVFGAGVTVRGGDASAVQIGRIDSQRCGISLHDMALYGVKVGVLCAQSVGVAYAMGNNPSASNIGGGCGGFYCEGNDIDILRVSRSELSKTISSVYVISPQKIRYTCAARLSTGELTGFNNLKTVTWQYQGVQLRYEERTNASSSTLDLTSASRDDFIVNRDLQTFNISAPNLDILQHFGLGSRSVKVIGTGANGAPTGQVTFNAPSGYTVNGGSSAAFNGFSSFATFLVFLPANSTDIKVYCNSLT